MSTTDGALARHANISNVAAVNCMLVAVVVRVLRMTNLTWTLFPLRFSVISSMTFIVLFP